MKTAIVLLIKYILCFVARLIVTEEAWSK